MERLESEARVRVDGLRPPVLRKYADSRALSILVLLSSTDLIKSE
jgi:hypothetical protein